MMTYENAPMNIQRPSDWRKKIFHATFALAESMCAGSDAPPGQYQKPQASLYSSLSVIQWKRSVFSKPWQKTELFKCRSRKHFGRFVSAFSLTNLGFHG